MDLNGEEKKQRSAEDILLKNKTREKQLLVHKVFYQSISYLLNSMRLFGMFFEMNQSEEELEGTEILTKSSVTTSRVKIRWGGGVRVGYVYACIVQVGLWLNLVRCLTMFTTGEHIGGSLISKLGTFSFTCMCTLMHSTCFIACRSGKIVKVLNELAERSCANLEDCDSSKSNGNADNLKINVNEDRMVVQDIEVSTIALNTKRFSVIDRNRKILSPFSTSVWPVNKSLILDDTIRSIFSANNVKRNATMCIVVAWGLFFLNVPLMMYAMYATAGKGFYLAPFGTYISTTNITPVKLVNIIALIYISAGWGMPMAMAYFIAICLRREFQNVNLGFKEAVTLEIKCTGNRGGTFSGNIESYRILHHKIARLVDKADKFLCLYYGSVVIGNIAIFTIVLYLMLFYPAFTQHTLVKIIGAFWLLTACLQLMMASTGAILVNNFVSFPISRFVSSSTKSPLYQAVLALRVTRMCTVPERRVDWRGAT